MVSLEVYFETFHPLAIVFSLGNNKFVYFLVFPFPEKSTFPQVTLLTINSIL